MVEFRVKEMPPTRFISDSGRRRYVSTRSLWQIKVRHLFRKQMVQIGTCMHGVLSSSQVILMLFLFQTFAFRTGIGEVLECEDRS